jgi:hypothetical protein
MKNPDDPETRALLAETKRLTDEMAAFAAEGREMANERRRLFYELKSRGVTYPRMAEVAGLHKMTIQQDVATWRKAQIAALGGG